ncbi:MAG: hypothetical protein JWO46_1220 [Nocardioidaceae bacterium]|nr:hypothetical protein [Nocardioidaceae bacterium]
MLQKVGIQVLGWIVLLAGVAMIALPGPGLIGIFLGLYLLATQYAWAERRLEPVQKAALQSAADSVATVPRILMSSIGVAWLIGLGVYWGLQPDVPDWWPLRESWWLPGGWGTGSSLILSGLIALALIVYSYRNFREIKASDPTP